jgi:5-formyltetrahydrofolate cyclo-ligase
LKNHKIKVRYRVNTNVKLTLEDPVTKHQLRLELTSRLKSMSLDERQNAESLLINRLQRLLVHYLDKTHTQTWGLYHPHQFEPNLQPLVEECKKNGLQMTWVFPQVVGKGLRWLVPGKEGFIKGSFGILEPHVGGAKEVSKNELNGVIIPGLGFDHQGIRLGRGQGYYDRELSRLDLVKIGVGFHCQLMSELPSEAHDIKMDLVVTDREEIGSLWK